VALGGSNVDLAFDVIVVGAGAAGLVAATEAAHQSRRTLLIEKNRRPGVKILMSGGTRCNLTHATDKWGIVRAYGEQGSFLHSALAALSPADLVALIESEGVATKVEDTGKIFPVSNRATDVLDALLRRLASSGAELALDEPVQSLSVDRERGGFRLTTSKRELAAEKLIVTVGGKSYPGSGTTGDGYGWAQALGHAIVPPRPSLVPLATSDKWVHDLSGVTVPDVAVQVVAAERKPLDRRRGSFLFTHFGVSGPAVLDVSRAYTALAEGTAAKLVCDFVPGATSEQLEGDLRRAASADGKRLVINVFADSLPKRLLETLFMNASISVESRAAEFSKANRAALFRALKSSEIAITGTRGFAKAEVTAGGVALSEVDSRTMQSKFVPGLYFAGEVLDLDGPIGGYNFQAAFSTGVLAGRSV
jgi:predicted Rossmann fold flavoprotein